MQVRESTIEQELIEKLGELKYMLVKLNDGCKNSFKVIARIFRVTTD